MGYKIKIDPADTAFSQWIRLRDRQCVKCGSPVRFNEKGLPISHQASHFKGRKKESTRFDPNNVDTLCWGCHSYFGSQPNEHYDWQVARKGQDMVDKLILASNLYAKRDRKSEAIYWKAKLKADFGVG